MDNELTYEQPLNEVIRVCLRLEQLFQQIDHHIKDDSPLSTRNLVSLIINVLHILDRPDIKAKLAKELSHHLTNMMRLENTPDIDRIKWQSIIEQLDNLSRSFIDSSGKIGHSLRDIELLNNLRLHLASPGGGCSFDIPLYYYWLHQPPMQCQETIRSWLSEFNPVRTATELLLKLVRNGAKMHTKAAVHGFYQELLDPQLNLRMIRVIVKKNTPAFPEISVGRHFLSVRFFIPDIEKKPTQHPENITFQLAYCSS
ncbi:MAG: hypothetical protein A3E83_02205 [Gammaproteobacteria bacterium RIFCSPHIGHO2_12_FULL_41_20]|nr:MAG: hypothetical protein A3E83_02205 [Gammaproteobacteria bacterium RIFCSPHIGHO2_12_FULL_41_20]